MTRVQMDISYLQQKYKYDSAEWDKKTMIETDRIDINLTNMIKETVKAIYF